MLKFGKDPGFFRLLEAQAAVAEEAAQAFRVLVQDMGNIEAHAETISDLEHKGDELTHELQSQVAAVFITPLDKEDLRALSQTLDDVTDLIEAVAARASLYRLRTVRPDLEPLAELLVHAARVVHEAVKELKNGFATSETLQQKLLEIHTIENESDKNFRNALANLFHEEGADPLTVIKWKEVYDRVEAAVDKCEDIAAIIGTVVVKYA